MNSPLLWRLAALMLACLAAPAAFAAPAAAAAADATDTALTIETYLATAVVERDGSADIRTKSVWLINEPRGIALLAQQSIEYNRSRESLEVLEAYTQKANGRRVPVAPAQIVDRPEAAGYGAPMFQDGRVTTLSYPELEQGDRVVYVTRLRRHAPMYPGQFEQTLVPPLYRIGQLRVVYDLPQDMALAGDAAGFSAAAPVSHDGRTRYQWDYVPGPAARIERGAVNYADYGKRLFVSTFRDYAALATAYDARSSDKAGVTPAIAALAAQLTAGQPDARAKAYALNDWVRHNVRYVALYINAGGVVPHDAAQVLANRYGDCKDHTVLMEALLTAAGIASTPALVNLGNAYRLAAVPVNFNHVITYVPALGLYLDSTAPEVRSGYLPPGVLDKQVLLTRSGQLAHMPPTQPGSISARAVVRIAADGSADLENRATFGASWGEPARMAMQSESAAALDRIVGLRLQQAGQRGSGTVRASAIAGKPDDVLITTRGHSEDMVALPGPVGLRASSNLGEDLASNVTALLVEKTRSQDLVCLNGDFDEQARYELAKELKVIAIPAPLAIHAPDLDYSADYVAADGAVTVTRRLRLFHPNARCTPADFALQRPALARIARDLKAQIILQAQGRPLSAPGT